MVGTYYETDRMSSLIFVLVICAVLYLALYIDRKVAEKKGRNINCIACENRGGDYIPKNCKNCHCKFYMKGGDKN